MTLILQVAAIIATIVIIRQVMHAARAAVIVSCAYDHGHKATTNVLRCDCECHTRKSNP